VPPGLVPLALLLEEPAQACGSSQLERPCTLSSGYLGRLAEAPFRVVRFGAGAEKQQIPVESK
jgi:hypothetical protein